MLDENFGGDIHPKVSLLFQPLKLGTLTIRNRVVSTAHSTGLSDQGLIGNEATSYYRGRAEGGVGLILTGSTSVHPSSSSRLKPALTNWDDAVLKPYEKLGREVHRFGTRIFVQLNHAGGLSGSGGPFGCVVGPSAMNHEIAVETAREITHGEMDELVYAFGRAALRVQAAGLDGVEIHGGHGNLIQQFLSPHTNKRIDGYGGSLEGRARFGREVAARIRSVVGPDFPVGLRLSVEEDYDNGLDLQETPRIARNLIKAGRLNYVNVTSGSDTSPRSLPRHYAPMYVRSGHMRRLVRPIRDAVDVPVLAVGRFTDPLDAEALLRSGDADMVGMTRALIADRDLPNKARKGDFSSFRYCVGANEGCLGRLFRGASVTCIQDPTSGREHIFDAIEVAALKKRVVVVGGGIAGLEAARVAALRGHDVTLLERDSSLGGQLRLARKAPGREELGAIIGNLERQIEQLDVQVRLQMDATADAVIGLKPDAVFLATGSAAFVPDNLDDGYGRLVSARAALDGAMVGNLVVVYDTRADYVAPTTAEFLARKGHQVTLATTGRGLGAKIEPMTLRIIEERLADLGISVLVSTSVQALTEEGVKLRNLLTGQDRILPDIATVVISTGSRPNQALHASIVATRPDITARLIGDARSPHDIEAAIYDAHVSARGA